jgi:hypothetical protein
MNGRWLIPIRLATAVLALAAIGAQILTLADAGALNLVNFFSYFTIQSNLIGIVVLLLAARSGRRSEALDWWRGAAALYLTVTFIVVILLLSNVDVGLQLVWVDIVLHKVTPIVVVADFLLDPPSHRLTISDGLRWLIYPLAWLGYTLIRGPIASWYPYPFLDPDKAANGYVSVAITSVVILVAGAVLGALLVWLGNRFGPDGMGRRPG